MIKKFVLIVAALTFGAVSASQASAQGPPSDAPLTTQTPSERLGFAATWKQNHGDRGGIMYELPPWEEGYTFEGRFNDNCTRRLVWAIRTPDGRIYDPCLEEAREEWHRAMLMCESVEKQAYGGIIDGPGKYFARYTREQLFLAWECLFSRAQAAWDELYGPFGQYWLGITTPGTRSVLGHCEFDCPEVRLTMPKGYDLGLEGPGSPTERFLNDPERTQFYGGPLTGEWTSDRDLRDEVPTPYAGPGPF